MEFLWALIVMCFILILSKKWFQRSSNLPPGPLKIPILGNLHQMGPEPHKTFLELRNLYGDVFSFQFGSYPGVVLNGHKTIKEALSSSSFNGRHKETVAFPRDGGIVLGEGRDWADQRRFALKTLRDFGFGKKSAESLIITEVVELIDRFKSTVGTPNDYMLVFNAAVLNSLWSMLTGRRFPHDDPQLLEIVSILSNASTQANGMSAMAKLSFFISWLQPLRKVSPILHQLSEFVKKTLNMMQNIIDEHKQSPTSSEVGDYIDAYLKEIASTADPSSSFWGHQGEKNLRVALFDLFLGGTETTASTLTYALQYLAMYPEIQDKLFGEISEKIGTTRFPSLADRNSLTYAEAVILEILRHSALIPRSIPHKTTETVQFKGYTIPKGWIVVPNLYSALYDPKEWDQPEMFNPDRFLSAEGVVSKHHEALIPFSVGKRICPGESLARDQLFLFLCSLVQRFKFKQDPNSPPLKIEYSVTPLVLAPVAKPLVVEERI